MLGKDMWFKLYTDSYVFVRMKHHYHYHILGGGGDLGVTAVESRKRQQYGTGGNWPSSLSQNSICFSWSEMSLLYSMIHMAQ